MAPKNQSIVTQVHEIQSIVDSLNLLDGLSAGRAIFSRRCQNVGTVPEKQTNINIIFCYF